MYKNFILDDGETPTRDRCSWFVHDRARWFPSEKDPNWSTTHPERKDKSTVAIVTLGKWEWFSQWVDEPLKRRGEDYEGSYLLRLYLMIT